MTREEVQRVLMAIQVLYPNFKVDNASKTATIDLWMEMLSDLSYEQVSRAVRSFASTDTKGFAPGVGQIRAIIAEKNITDVIDEGRAWELVYNALQNGNYGADEEYNKLPDDIRRTLGGPGQIRQWAVADVTALTVAESNFKRAYRGVIERRLKLEALPMELRPQIGAAPVAKIEDKNITECEANQASEEFVSSLLERFRADLV